jgi:hypothetical protein
MTWLRLLLLATTTAMASCAEVQQLLPVNQPATRAPLSYYAWIESADKATLDQERSRLTEQADIGNPAINLIQRALFYSVPADADDSNVGSAMELLSVALQDTPDSAAPSALQSEYTAFARIWLDLLEQQRNYQSARLNQQSDKDLIRELSVKVDRLEQQIQALTTIEQRLMEREQEQVQP